VVANLITSELASLQSVYYTVSIDTVCGEGSGANEEILFQILKYLFPNVFAIFHSRANRERFSRNKLSF
jgi:hypothetical protein